MSSNLPKPVAINYWGDYVVSYTQSQVDYWSGAVTASQVYAARFTWWGGLQSQVSVGDTWDPRFESESSVSLDDSGRFVVAYTHQSRYDDRDVRAQVFDANGNSAQGWFYVSSRSDSDEFAPTVALGNDGQFVVGFGTYRQKRAPTQTDPNTPPWDYRGYGVSIQRFAL